MRGFAAEGAASRARPPTTFTKTGSIVPLKVGLSALGSGDEPLYTAIVRDVSDRVAAAAALTLAAARANAANHAKGALLATMIHETRTPLNGVLGMAQAMARDDPPSRQKERLEVIRQSGETLLVIPDDLLDLAKIEAGKQELEDAEFDLAELVTGSHATFAAFATQEGPDLDLRILGQAPVRSWQAAALSRQGDDAVRPQRRGADPLQRDRRGPYEPSSLRTSAGY